MPNTKNYPDFFATVGKSMVKKPDGTFITAVNDTELTALKSRNKIGLEYPTAMGGKVTDLTQKPVMVLREEQNSLVVDLNANILFATAHLYRYY
jgi:hypothetical protein